MAARHASHSKPTCQPVLCVGVLSTSLKCLHISQINHSPLIFIPSILPSTPFTLHLFLPPSFPPPPPPLSFLSSRSLPSLGELSIFNLIYVNFKFIHIILYTAIFSHSSFLENLTFFFVVLGLELRASYFLDRWSTCSGSTFEHFPSENCSLK
jgi:hypothetical protein